MKSFKINPMKTLLSIFLALFFLSNFNQSSFSQLSDYENQLNQVFGKQGEVYFTFKVDLKADLKTLSRIISIDKVTTDMNVYAYANREEFAQFLEKGIAYQILPHPGTLEKDLNMKSHVNLREINDWNFYPTYEGYVDLMYQFQATYPELCQVFSIGETNEDHELLMARISDNVGINENEPEFLYTSSMHGDELTGYVLMLHLIDYLLSNYGSDPEVTEIVNNIDIFINPLANPDGAYAGGNNTVNGATRYNALFVDLNRNYPDPEAGPHPDGNPWQVETIAFMNFAEAHDLVSGANLHGGAEVCNYPWDTWQHLAADNDWWVYVCREYADTVHEYGPPGYMTDLDNGITNGYAWYWVTGGRQDYMNYFHQCREFTLEISDDKTPPASQLPSFWNYNYRSLLNYMEQCQFGIRGTVKDAATGWPIQAEVNVLLHEEDSSWVYSSLPNGNYHRLLAEGNYTVRYSAPGYENAVISNLVVQNRQATVVDVLLVPSTGVGGIGYSLVNDKVNIYPNPVVEEYIQINSSVLLNEIKVFDIAGRELLTVGVDRKKYQLDLSGFRNGVYFVLLNTEIGKGVKKIIINR